MKNMEGVELSVNRKHVTLINVLDNFPEVTEVFPSIPKSLKPDAQIVHNPLFEDATIQIQSEEKRQISAEQRRLVRVLREPSPSNWAETNAPLSLLERARKKR